MLSLFLSLPAFLAPYLKDETISGYADPVVSYRLEAINDAPFDARATISFPAEGRIEGNGPCNTYSTTQSAPYPWFETGPIAATKRACPDLALESEFFAALPRMTLIEVAGEVLLLTNDAGEVMAFRAQPAR